MKSRRKETRGREGGEREKERGGREEQDGFTSSTTSILEEKVSGYSKMEVQEEREEEERMRER